jgi:iron complex transport system substrate-binding protein
VRICSLLPAATEIVGALGLAGQLVGRSHECDWPPSVRDLPVVTASRVDTTRLTGLEVDRAVRAALVDGRALYALDEALVDELEPELVITQDTCEVCAVSSDEVRLCGIAAEVLSLDARTISEVETTVLVLAERLGVTESGRAVVEAMRTRLAEIRVRVAALDRPRVFVAEWLDPPFAAGHWVPEMVELAGGLEVLGRAGEPSYRTTWDAVAAAEPDLVVVAPCGYEVDRGAAEAREAPLPCRAVAVDANAYYSRPAPRLADGVAQLAHLLHPEAVPDPGLPSIEVGST